MSDDLIRRAEAIDALNDTLADYLPILIGSTEEIPLKCAKAIYNLPSAGPQRMREGWNTYYHGGTDFSYSCARCGYGAPFDRKGEKVFQKKWNYCPNCGADMRGEQDANTD